MKQSVISLGIPFGKFIDPNIVNTMTLVEQKVIDSPEYETIYLLKSENTNEYYCCFEFDPGIGGGPSDDPEESMQEFVKTYGGTIEMIPPKHSDWFVTHYLARVLMPQN